MNGCLKEKKITLFFCAKKRYSNNFFSMASKSFAWVIAFTVVQMACEQLGGNYYLLSPALAAWLPLIIFAPVATWNMHALWE